jgi:AcrR family transcriptional regulator
VDTQPARRGRPRSEESRQAILRAAIDLLAESGYAALSIEGIAARSGTGKQTVYRWWPSKADVVLEALAGESDVLVPLPDTGSWPADLRAFLAASFALGRKPRVVEVLRALMAQAQLDPGFHARFRAGFLQRRREALGVLLDRAVERGELPSGVSAATVADIVFGVIWYRVLTTTETGALADAPLADELAGELVAVLT